MGPDVAWGGEEGWDLSSRHPPSLCLAATAQAENNTLPAQFSQWVVQCWTGQCLLTLVSPSANFPTGIQSLTVLSQDSFKKPHLQEGFLDLPYPCPNLPDTSIVV